MSIEDLEAAIKAKDKELVKMFTDAKYIKPEDTAKIKELSDDLERMRRELTRLKVK